MSIFSAPNTPSENTLLLHPNGYPVYIDVPQASHHGALTFMRFRLPLNGHNFPLCHQKEEKIAVALVGEIEIRSAGKTIATLHQGQAVIVPRGKQHRLYQSGHQPAEVGIILRPGLVEQAFRDLSEKVKTHGYSREHIIDLLAPYDVVWDKGNKISPDGHILSPLPYSHIARELAMEFNESLLQVWTWLD